MKKYLKLKSKSKILVLGLILIALVGLFGLTNSAKAQIGYCKNFSFTFKIDYTKTIFVGGAIIDKNQPIHLITTITNNNSWLCNSTYAAKTTNWLVGSSPRPEYNSFASNFETSANSVHTIRSQIILGTSVGDKSKDVPIWRGVALRKVVGLYGYFDGTDFGNDKVTIAYRPPETPFSIIPRNAPTGCYDSLGRLGGQTNPTDCVAQGHTYHFQGNDNNLDRSNPSGCFNPLGQSSLAPRAQCTSPNVWFNNPRPTGGGGCPRGSTGTAPPNCVCTISGTYPNCGREEPPPPPPPQCPANQIPYGAGKCVPKTCPPDKMRDQATGNCIPGVCPPGTGTWPNCVLKQDAIAGYHLLEPLPVSSCAADDKGCVCTGEGDSKKCELIAFNPSGPNKFGEYLNFAIRLIIGLCAVAAVIMIVVGGIQYSASELISGKEDAKERIKNAILGLLLALCSYLILYTINPDLLKTEVDVAGVALDVEVTDYDITAVINFNNGGGYSGGGGALPKQIAGTICDYRVVAGYAQAASIPLTENEAKVFACLAASESSCGNNAGDSGTGAYGVFQVLLNTHRECFNNSAVCRQVVGGQSVGCPGGANCRRAASNAGCSTTAAMCVLRKQLPPFSPWTTDYIQANGRYESHAKQRRCANAHGFPTPPRCFHALSGRPCVPR